MRNPELTIMYQYVVEPLKRHWKYVVAAHVVIGCIIYFAMG